MRKGVHRALLFACLTATAAAAANAEFTYTTQRDRAAAEVVIDSRPLADCRRLTLAGARCLPADGFLGPQRRLPSERDILWLLGTAGLDGSEAVLVVGDAAPARDFVGGLLYLAGQRRVRILDAPLAPVLAADKGAAAGAERGMVRSAVFTAPMRAERLVLKHELIQAAAPALLDGRSEREYRGETRRGARGGHLPGAHSLPAATLTGGPSLAPLPAGAVAYAHDAFEGIAYFTRLVAGFGLPLRVYADGWAEWAADAGLPVAAASAGFSASAASTAEVPQPAAGTSAPPLALAAAGVLLAALAGAWYHSQRRMA